MNTPEDLQELRVGEYFVFGSNIFGLHYGGAAKLAHEKFNAEWGIGEGLTGSCYAFPTLYSDLSQRSKIGLETSRNKLYSTARSLSEKTFFLTKVGCGIAGFQEDYMRDLFRDSPRNIIKPVNW